MEAATWIAIGLVTATSLGTLFYLGAQIDGRLDDVKVRVDVHLGRHAG